MTIVSSRIIAQSWLMREREYADSKYDDRQMEDDHMDATGFDEDSFWFTELANRLKRVQILGLENPAGMQALGKLVVATMSAFESAIRCEYELPKPGYPSGQIVRENA